MGLDLKGTHLKQNKPQGKIVRCASRVEAFIGFGRLNRHGGMGNCHQRERN